MQHEVYHVTDQKNKKEQSQGRDLLIIKHTNQFRVIAKTSHFIEII